ncbi:MAG: CpsD/CapB family tyrosine-protein kinase [Myxococcales bacterium]|nr:CpsD/CapB family tyrosine-protein kinase [Myxococcales bacterium]
MPVDPSRTLVLVRGEPSGQGPTGTGESPVRVVPAWASPPDTHVLVMLGDTAPEATGALRVLRHRLEQKRASGMWVFGVTSARAGDGKSTFAAQLALVLSESQRARVLLLEANFAKPSLARILGFKVPQNSGFSTQLARKMRGSPEPWCVVALGPALHVLAEDDREAGFPETLHSTFFSNAITFLARGYDFLVVDAPSILGSGDANVVENAVDAMILVARSGVTQGNDLQAAVKQLGDRKAMGVVLWNAESTGKAQRT